MNNKILIIETDDVFTGQCKTHLEGLGIDVLAIVIITFSHFELALFVLRHE